MSRWPTLSNHFVAPNNISIVPLANSEEATSMGITLQNGLSVNNPYFEAAERGLLSIIDIRDDSDQTIACSSLRVKDGKVYPSFVRGYNNREITSGPAFDAIQAYCTAVNDRTIELNTRPAGDVFENLAPSENHNPVIDGQSLWQRVATGQGSVGSLGHIATFSRRIIEGPAPIPSEVFAQEQFRPTLRSDLVAEWLPLSPAYLANNGLKVTPIGNEAILYSVAQFLENAPMDNNFRGQYINACNAGQAQLAVLTGDDGIQALAVLSVQGGSVVPRMIHGQFEAPPTPEQQRAIAEYCNEVTRAPLYDNSIAGDQGFVRHIGLGRTGFLTPEFYEKDNVFSFDENGALISASRADEFSPPVALRTMGSAGEGRDALGSLLNGGNTAEEEEIQIIPIPGLTDNCHVGSVTVGSNKPDSLEDFMDVAETYIRDWAEDGDFDPELDVDIRALKDSFTRGEIYPAFVRDLDEVEQDFPIILKVHNGRIVNLLEDAYDDGELTENSERLLPLLSIMAEDKIDFSAQAPFKKYVRNLRDIELKAPVAEAEERVINIPFDFDFLDGSYGPIGLSVISGPMTLSELTDAVHDSGSMNLSQAEKIAKVIADNPVLPIAVKIDEDEMEGEEGVILLVQSTEDPEKLIEMKVPDVEGKRSPQFEKVARLVDAITADLRRNSPHLIKRVEKPGNESQGPHYTPPQMN